MAARTTQDMLHAASAMGQSAAWRAGGDPSPAHERRAHADFARYAASAAFNSLEHTRYRQARALDAHRATPSTSAEPCGAPSTPSSNRNKGAARAAAFTKLFGYSDGSYSDGSNSDGSYSDGSSDGSYSDGSYSDGSSGGSYSDGSY